MSVFDQIINILKENDISYELTEHEPVRTSEEAAKIRGSDLNSGAKAMIVKNTSGKENSDLYMLFVMPGNKLLDWKKARLITGYRKLRLATEEEAQSLTGLQMGGVPPLGNILGIKSYYDKDILQNEFVNFNAGLREKSIRMRLEDLIKIVNPDFF